jgi:hypothetical protein
MVTEEKYEELHKAFDELLKEAEDAKKAVLDKFAIMSLKAKEFGIDLLSSKENFLSEIGKYGDKQINAGILEFCDNIIISKATDIILTLIVGKDWFDKLKKKVGICTLVDGKLVEPAPNEADA